MTTQSEVLEYARRVKAEKSAISPDELRSVLQSRFIDGCDVLAAAHPRGGYAAINNPLDWLEGLISIFRGLRKFFQPEPDLGGILDIIDGVVRIVSEEQSQPA